VLPASVLEVDAFPPHPTTTKQRRQARARMVNASAPPPHAERKRDARLRRNRDPRDGVSSL
jgi:hypothetical protein